MGTVLDKGNNQRNSSIELLRVISILMILACHFATYGGFSYDMRSLSIPRLWWYIIEMCGTVGVNIFVLISGYFLITSNGGLFNLKRLLKIWGQVFIYSIAIYFIFCAAGISNFGLASCIKAVFPITFGAWWFASAYFVLLIIHPFLNMLLKKLDKSTYKALVITEVIIWSIIPTLTTSSFQCNNLLWLVTLYSVSGYIRLFGLNPKFSKKQYFIFFVLIFSLRFLSSVVLMIIGMKIPLAAAQSTFFFGQQSILTFLSSVSLFMAFEKWNMGYNKWINIMASATFGVYLIHENIIVRPFLWQVVFKNAQYQDSLFLIPYSVIVIAAVYIMCTTIDLLRQNTIEKPFMKLVDLYSEKIMNPFEKIIGSVSESVFGEDKRT